MGRRLGQHFLYDPAILDRIVDGLDPRPDDVVLEIGAGRGTLTRRLATRVGRVVAIERDQRLVGMLREGGTGRGEGSAALPGNVTVVEGDALALDWHAVVAEAGPPSFKVVGNIPYAITSPLIDKGLAPPAPPTIVFLVQREVADRLAAEPGGKAYGALTVGVKAVATVEQLFRVRPGAFRPPPKVESAVVRLTPLAEPRVAAAEQPAFRAFITALFGQRRKQLVGALRVATGLEREAIAERLAQLEVDPKLRCEALSPETLVRLHRALRDAPRSL